MPRARKLATVAGALALALCLTAPAASASGGGVLVVGDSLELLTSPYLQRYLPGVPLSINAEGGYNSYQVLELFEESYDPSQSVVVFDAGTNDNPAYPQILAENMAAVAATIGDRCMVVPTVHGFTVDGVDNTGKNSAVESFDASRPGTQTPDWAGAVATHPELMQEDGLHPNAEGADYRAQLIARGIEACLAIASAPPEPALGSGPELDPVGRLSRRQATLAAAIVTGLVRGIGTQITRRHLSVVAMLTMAASYA